MSRPARSSSRTYRNAELPKLKAAAEAAAGTGGGTLEAQTYQDAMQALDRLEKRVFYLQQARQLGIQQLPQIRIVQSGDETLIENLQATAALTVPAWKQKMVILLGLTQQKSALDMQKTVTDATNKMIREASEMMKDQAISIEEQAQRGIVDIETLQAANRDLIDTIQGVKRVQEEGRKKRAEAEQQMDQMTVELKKALTAGLRRPIMRKALSIAGLLRRALRRRSPRAAATDARSLSYRAPRTRRSSRSSRNSAKSRILPAISNMRARSTSGSLCRAARPLRMRCGRRQASGSICSTPAARSAT